MRNSKSPSGDVRARSKSISAVLKSFSLLATSRCFNNPSTISGLMQASFSGVVGIWRQGLIFHRPSPLTSWMDCGTFFPSTDVHHILRRSSIKTPWFIFKSSRSLSETSYFRRFLALSRSSIKILIAVNSSSDMYSALSSFAHFHLAGGVDPLFGLELDRSVASGLLFCCTSSRTNNVLPFNGKSRMIWIAFCAIVVVSNCTIP
mmetsp:Transcript_11900/g.27577  ORF Transcript_11900/g.27577 Transcript_11900/m.27577 type:complete len:204 (-) Transcript_11900:317-928(-)